MSDPFIGEIKAVGFNFAPNGYALANGALMAISQNNALFAVLGTFFGGNGVSNFQLPNLQSRLPIGAGQGAGLRPYVQGEVGGTESAQILTPNLPPHTHGITNNVTANTSVTPSLGTLAATTTLTALSAPTARVASPAGNFITQPQTAGTAPAGVLAFAAAGQGTTANLAAGSATTSFTGNIAVSASTNVQVASTATVVGSGVPLATLPPFVAVTYIIATMGIFPTRP